MDRFVLGTTHKGGFVGAAPAGRATEFHRRLPGYEPGRLRSLPSLAAELGIGALYVKDESERFGLPAFKILGASWAVFRTLSERLGGEPAGWTSVEELREAFAPLRPLALVTATDGNHGRAVARAARWFGLDARIFVPQGTADARIEAIRSEGAAVTVVDGSYDDAVAEAASQASERAIVVSDTSWPGYVDIPARVIEGYETIFAEADAALAEQGLDAPTIAFAQVGVGALAAAMAAHYRQPGAAQPVLVSLEPASAACALESVVAGEPVTVGGPHRSMMVGMNCGTLSMLAWPVLRDAFDLFVAMEDEHSAEAMRLLAAHRIVSGETGASGLGALLALLRAPGAAEAREALGIGRDTRALVVSTEGATDPAMYERIVGRNAAEVGR